MRSNQNKQFHKPKNTNNKPHNSTQYNKQIKQTYQNTIKTKQTNTNKSKVTLQSLAKDQANRAQPHQSTSTQQVSKTDQKTAPKHKT